jgi:hypothetical protein
VVRIGQELGLDPGAVRRAIGEVRGAAPAERGVLTSAMGPRTAHASRTIPMPAHAVRELLEQYLCRSEYMMVHRRFGDRTRFVRDTGFAAGMGRFARSFGRDHQPLDLREVDATVAPLDERSCLVTLAVDLTPVRAGLAAGGALGGGGAAAGIATAVLATPLVDPLALLGVPVLAASWFGMRGIYRLVSRGTREKLESFLDRLEHGEVRLPPARGSDPFGLSGLGIGLKR